MYLYLPHFFCYLSPTKQKSSINVPGSEKATTTVVDRQAAYKGRKLHSSCASQHECFRPEASASAKG